MNKPEKEIMYDLRECCRFIMRKDHELVGVDFWDYFQSNIHGANQNTAFQLDCMDEIDYIDYKDYTDRFDTEEDFVLMRGFYRQMVHEFGGSSYMRVWW